MKSAANLSLGVRCGSSEGEAPYLCQSSAVARSSPSKEGTLGLEQLGRWLLALAWMPFMGYYPRL